MAKVSARTFWRSYINVFNTYIVRGASSTMAVTLGITPKFDILKAAVRSTESEFQSTESEFQRLYHESTDYLLLLTMLCYEHNTK